VKYTFTLLEDGEREKLILESGGDLPRHVVLKLLAYVLYRKQYALEIEKGVGQRHKPDLVAQDPITGQVQLWIDCGQIETDRLGRIVTKNRHAEVIVVKATAREAERYATVAAKDVTGQATVLGFDDGFTERFVELLRGTNTVEIERLDETIRVVLNGEALESARRVYSCPA
jgi:YaeQ protein